MVADKLHLPAAGAEGSNSTTTRAVDVVFGCENVETGEIFRQRVDGVLGMGNNVNSLPRQVGRDGGTLVWVGRQGTANRPGGHLILTNCQGLAFCQSLAFCPKWEWFLQTQRVGVRAGLG